MNKCQGWFKKFASENFSLFYGKRNWHLEQFANDSLKSLDETDGKLCIQGIGNTIQTPWSTIQKCIYWIDIVYLKYLK